MEQMDGVLDVTIGYGSRDLASGRAEPSLGNLLLCRPPRPQPLHIAVRLLPTPAVDVAAVGAWATAVFEEKVSHPHLSHADSIARQLPTR
jgi:hypothetical protein